MQVQLVAWVAKETEGKGRMGDAVQNINIESYITVKEFAEKYGISTQAVYARCAELGELAIKGSRGWLISPEASAMFAGKNAGADRVKVASRLQAEKTELADEIERLQAELAAANREREVANELASGKDALCDSYRDMIETLNAQIAEQNRRISEKDRQIAEYSEKFAALARDALDTAARAQTLHAAQIVAGSRDGTNAEPDAEISAETAVDAQETPDEPNADTAGNSPENPRRRTLRERLLSLFNKNEG